MEGPDIKEAIQDDFRQWYMEYKRTYGKFPEFPSQEDWEKPDFKFSIENSAQDATVEETKKVDKKDKKEKKPEKKADKKDKKGKGEEEEVEDPLVKFNYGNSEFLVQIAKHQVSYNENWKGKDESDNFAQKHDQDIIKADKRKEIEAKIKDEVFGILQDELKNLILAVEKEGKGKKGKKGKGGKGKKGKKGKVF